MTADWKAEKDKWTIPVNFLLARMSTFGTFAANDRVGTTFWAAGVVYAEAGSSDPA